MDTISIIVPVFQVEHYLPRCIESIQKQTYSDLDIILIDDGSTDRSGEICDCYAKDDPRIRVYHTENRGLSAARNLGLEKARENQSQYIAFVDADDYLELQFVEMTYQSISLRDIDIVVCGYIREWKNRMIPFIPEEANYTCKEALIALLDGSIYTMVWGKLYKKELFDTIVFPEGRTFEDIAVLSNVIVCAKKVICIETVGYHWVMRSNSITHGLHSIQNIFDLYRAFKERYERLTAYSELASDHRLVRTLLKGCVISAFRIWRYYNFFSRQEKEQYREELHSIAAFLHENVPTFGFSDWGMLLRLYTLFVRYDSKLSLVAAYVINRIYQVLRIKKECLFIDE
ncbi:MAG: glycosyltransferase family 2 protein [Clostridia bacterium]|nr:glycosyltransferase family 2 protein [Clostridia bacterium]